MDFSKVTAIEIPEGKVAEIEDNKGSVLWSALPDPNKYAYGIRWDHTVPDSQATTACERIGNLELHKTLPIQSKFATCIHQGTDIKYWCDPNDSRFRKDNTGYRIVDERIWLTDTTDAEKNAVPSDYSPSPTYTYTIQFPDFVLAKYSEAVLMVTTYKYLYAWVKINDTVIARVNKVDTVNKKAYITTDGLITGETIVPTLEFGCSINGYDGEISVYTPKFYIWSVDNDGAGNEVWQSEKKCVNYAREVKAHLIGISRCPLLRTAMNDDKWGWLNTLSANTAVSVVNYQPNLRGGTNNTSYDQYLGDNNFRTMLGKAVSSVSLDLMRAYTQKIKDSQVLYYQIWSAIVWCYFIEYADFNVKKAFNSNLTNEGYHQGGLGEGLSSINSWKKYSAKTPTIPVDYTLGIGNTTGIVANLSHSFTIKSLNDATWKNWNLNRVTATTNNKILNITAIPKIYNDWILNIPPDNVGGTYKYKIEGLTGGQTVVFKRQQGNLTITTDGEYDVNWGTNYSNRNIIFGKAQETCNIKITILSSSSVTYTLTQKQFDIPCYRGFNGFWYGDTWLNIENFISQYDSKSNKRKFYFTDNPNNFSNDISNKEIIVDVNSPRNGWSKNIMVGKTANLIIDKTSDNSNYINAYRWENTLANKATAFIGGISEDFSKCSLVYLYFEVLVTGPYVTFAKCYILN